MLLGALGVLVIAWLIIKATQAGQTFLTETLNGLTLAALYFVVAAGFTLIFGLMRVVNMAQGSLYLFGGYVAYVSQTHWFSGGTSQFQLGGSTSTSVAGWVVPVLLERRGAVTLDVTYISAITGVALFSRRLNLLPNSAVEEQRFPWEPPVED